MMKFWIYENHICELQSEELYKIAYNYAMIFLHIISKILICLPTRNLGVLKNSFKSVLVCSRSNWNLILKLLVLGREEKWKEPTTTSTPTHCMALTLDSNPGHSGGR